MYRLITYGVETTYKDPDDPGKDATPAQIKAYGLLFTAAREDRLQYHNNKIKTFRLIMGQCTPTMKQRVQATPEYKTWEDPEKCDVKSLLALLKALGPIPAMGNAGTAQEASEDQTDPRYEP
jgi:hypothetical protein